MSYRQYLGSFTAFLIVGLVLFLSPVTAEEAQETTEKDPPRDESIIGGKAVRDGQYKFVTALIDESRAGDDYQRQFCGGTLIDSNSVLTAAHCIDGRSTGQIRVVVGRTVLTSNQGISRDVSSAKIHPKFRGVEVNSKYDAAVLQLKSPVQGISPIRISGAGNDALENPGKVLTIAGWGNTARQPPSGGGGRNYPNRMRQANVPVVSDSKTASAYNRSSVPSQLRFFPAFMLGAGNVSRDTCQGDSGGPIFSKSSTKIQVGITSYGAGCASKGYPGVYTEINSKEIRSFILGAS